MMDERSFTEALLQSEPMLYRIACPLLRQEEDRKDALQETALRAWQSRGKLREEKYFKTWITRILINVCHSIRRKNAKYVPADNLPERPAPPERDSELRVMLEALPEKNREALVLYYLEGMSVKEIAAVLRVPAGTVKYRLHQARKALQVELDEKEVRV